MHGGTVGQRAGRRHDFVAEYVEHDFAVATAALYLELIDQIRRCTGVGQLPATNAAETAVATAPRHRPAQEAAQALVQFRATLCLGERRQNCSASSPMDISFPISILRLNEADAFCDTAVL